MTRQTTTQCFGEYTRSGPCLLQKAGTSTCIISALTTKERHSSAEPHKRFGIRSGQDSGEHAAHWITTSKPCFNWVRSEAQIYEPGQSHLGQATIFVLSLSARR